MTTPAAPLPPGIHPHVPADTYHADPCTHPSLSASIAKILCNRSPRHAWEAHPRLNPDHQPDIAAKYDLGTVCHAMLLEGEDVVQVVDAQDWRTKAAKAARDAARADGLVPLLAHDHDTAGRMVAAIRGQLDQIDVAPPLLVDGIPEATLVWEDAGGVMCRARADWLRHDITAIDDLKTTSGSANPREWAQRRMWDLGFDVQAAMYLRGLRALAQRTSTTPEFRFIVAETAAPYAVSVISLAPSALALANDKVTWAIDTWQGCVRSGEWPGYPQRVVYAESPAWQETQWAEARYQEEAMAR